MDNDRTLFTIWQFSSPTTGDSRTVVRFAEPDDVSVQHEYQKVLGQVMASSKREALKIFEG